jgi:serine/threonine-protein kinase RsbW
MAGPVSIRIPADTAHVALVRAAAKALAVRVNFPFDRLTELDIAIDEVCSRILAVTEDPTRITVTFELGESSLSIVAFGDGTRRRDREPFTEWSRVILEAIADQISTAESNGSITFRLRLSTTPT